MIDKEFLGLYVTQEGLGEEKSPPVWRALTKVGYSETTPRSLVSLMPVLRLVSMGITSLPCKDSCYGYDRNLRQGFQIIQDKR